MELAGVSAEDIERFFPPPEEREAEPFAILPENWPSLRVFLACGTKWQVDAMSGRVRGIDFAQAEVVMNMYRIRRADREIMFDDLVAMEGAALPLLNRSK